ncbi:MAG: hypothetical protein ABI904_00375 [Chloroflexota bacterium]
MNEGTRHPISIFDPIQDLEHDQLGRFQFAKRLLKRVSLPDCPSTVRPTQFIKQCFINGQDLETICKSLAGTMLWLRQAGLP